MLLLLPYKLSKLDSFIVRLQLNESDKSLALPSSVFAALSMFIAVMGIGKYSLESPDSLAEGKSRLIFIIFFLLNMLCSFLVPGLLTGTLPFNQWLYPVNLLVIWFLLSKAKNHLTFS